MAQKGFWNIAKKRESWKIEELCPKKTETCSVNIGLCTKRIFVAILAQAIWFENVVKQCDFQREHFCLCVVPGSFGHDQV